MELSCMWLELEEVSEVHNNNIILFYYYGVLINVETSTGVDF
jgi:hypothetical protein